MDEYEIIPIDGDSPTEDDVIPTEDEAEEIEISDEPYGPTDPTEPDAPEQADDGDEPEPAYIIEPDDEDTMPTEEEAEEIVIDDAEYTGGDEPEPDINDNEAEITMVGAVREGDVFPALKLGSSLMGIAPAGWGDRVQSEVDLASQAATEAKAVAQATGQHFWEDDNGAHVTEITKDEWKAEEAEETPFADVSDSKPYHNLLMNSLGILLRTALKNLVSITRSAIAFFDGQGNDAANVVASFGKDGFQVGTTGKSHLVGDYHSLIMTDTEGDYFFQIRDLRDRDGIANLVAFYYGDGVTASFPIGLSNITITSVKIDGVETTAYTRDSQGITLAQPLADGSQLRVDYKSSESNLDELTFGFRTGASSGAMSASFGEGNEASGICSFAEGAVNVARGMYSHVEGYNSDSFGYASHAEGRQSLASGDNSHAEGSGTTASGDDSHAEGSGTVASYSYAHAEGYGTVASNSAAHGEGNQTTASGVYSHSEGSDTEASGWAAHSEGQESIASGYASHAQNLGTIAAKKGQTALGKYNVEDTTLGNVGQYAAIIGNGTSDSNRSNALTVGWDGSVDAAGDASIAGDAAIGGTLGVTGATTHESTIYVNGANVNNMWMRDGYANADYDGVPSSGANTTRTVGMIDSDDDQLARVSFRQRSDGRRCAGLEAHGFNSGGTGVWNSLWAVVDKAGNRSYEMSDPAAFREALRMRSGVVATRSVAAGSVTTVDVDFSPALSAAPNVVCGLQSTQTQLMGNCSCVVTATSAAGFTVALVNNATSARNLGCYWIAM